MKYISIFVNNYLIILSLQAHHYYNWEILTKSNLLFFSTYEYKRANCCRLDFRIAAGDKII